VETPTGNHARSNDSMTVSSTEYEYDGADMPKSIDLREQSTRKVRGP